MWCDTVHNGIRYQRYLVSLFFVPIRRFPAFCWSSRHAPSPASCHAVRPLVVSRSSCSYIYRPSPRESQLVTFRNRTELSDTRRCYQCTVTVTVTVTDTVSPAEPAEPAEPAAARSNPTHPVFPGFRYIIPTVLSLPILLPVPALSLQFDLSRPSFTDTRLAWSSRSSLSCVPCSLFPVCKLVPDGTPLASRQTLQTCTSWSRLILSLLAIFTDELAGFRVEASASKHVVSDIPPCSTVTPDSIPYQASQYPLHWQALTLTSNIPRICTMILSDVSFPTTPGLTFLDSLYKTPDYLQTAQDRCSHESSSSTSLDPTDRSSVSRS